jgi:hypothetical protein
LTGVILHRHFVLARNFVVIIVVLVINKNQALKRLGWSGGIEIEVAGSI